MRLFLTTALLGFILRSVAPAATPEEAEFFEKQVRPVLADHCFKCHGAEKQKGEIRVDSRAAILRGVDGVPVAMPGNPDESSLIKSIRHQTENKMPAKEPKLADEQIAALAEWVRMGMPWPDADQSKAMSPQQQAAKSHWSYQPIQNPEPPHPVDSGSRAQSPIDQFILAKLEAAKLQPAAPTDKRTLLRRASFDLTGLPPTAEEVEAFENDATPDAFAHVVDRLLASPRYGERWGRHWLDVARYADTRGYLAGGEERRFAYSYTYRDWVIDALNRDLPYDQFIIQQLAADQIVKPGDDPSPLAAMGFLTLGRRFLNNEPDIIDDRIDVVSRGLMGLTTACARCHDHKFDPISQKDYYALYGIFASSHEPKELPFLQDTRDEKTRDEYQRELQKREQEISSFFDQRRTERAWLLSLALYVPVAPPVTQGALNRVEREKFTALRGKIEQLNGSSIAPPRAMVLNDKKDLYDPHVFIRGNPGRPGDAVPRRFLTVFQKGDPKPFTNGSGRLELGRAIASNDNPLTARVIVNRVWAYHFGKGLVRTPGDFGVKGELPTHPELLDWLASRFMADGWSLKKLHRLVMLSSVYQQSSDVAAASAQADPENRLLSHMNRQRLDYEAIRDTLLCVAGQLDLTTGGQPVDLTKPPYARRRAVYGFIDRQNLPGVFRTFDFASPDTTSPQRYVTTVPQQALFMMNSPFVIEQTQALAKKVAAEGEPKPEMIQDLYRQVLSRVAQESELQVGAQFIASQLHPPAAEPETPLWQYGYGSFDPATGTVSFKALPHWTGSAWQGGPKLPDAVSGYALLTATGGHGGSDVARSTIRRWVAPADATVDITGSLARPSEAGDGILARIISSRLGQLAEYTCEPQKTLETNVSSVEVKKGDIIDFIVEPRENSTSDSFTWAPLLRSKLSDWDARQAFAGPPLPKQTPLTAWEKYTQVLLSTNEFMFVD